LQSAPASAATPQSGPQNLFQLAQQQQATGGAPAAAGGALGGAAGRGPPGLDLAAIRDSPQFRQLRELVQQNPEMIQPIVQQLAASNPAVAQLVLQHPEALLDLLGVSQDALEGLDDEEGGHPGMTTVSVTEEEMASIRRVCPLFPDSLLAYTHVHL
jgi:UV excision repair protein RAD23